MFGTLSITASFADATLKFMRHRSPGSRSMTSTRSLRRRTRCIDCSWGHDHDSLLYTSREAVRPVASWNGIEAMSKCHHPTTTSRRSQSPSSQRRSRRWSRLSSSPKGSLRHALMSPLEDFKEADREQSRQSSASHKRIDESNRKGDDETEHVTNFCDDQTWLKMKST